MKNDEIKEKIDLISLATVIYLLSSLNKPRRLVDE
jgi:hypothetical protein